MMSRNTAKATNRFQIWKLERSNLSQSVSKGLFLNHGIRLVNCLSFHNYLQGKKMIFIPSVFSTLSALSLLLERSNDDSRSRDEWYRHGESYGWVRTCVKVPVRLVQRRAPAGPIGHVYSCKRMPESGRRCLEQILNVAGARSGS